MIRALVAWSLGIAAGIFGLTAGAGLTGSRWAAILIAAVVAGLVGLLVYRRPIVALEEAACSPGLKAVSGLATVGALVQIARLAVFMIDPSQVGYSAVPTSQWEVQHSCLSAYFVSSQALSSVPNVYDDSLYSMPDDDPAGPRKARMIGPFKIDVFEYPPPFLLLPRALRPLTPDFMSLRMLWFALNGGVVLLALLVVARLLGPVAGTRALLLSPLVWFALPTISTLQKGNVQAIVIAASMLAMALFERRRFAAGGALLAFATVSKLYPGLLVVYLLARRQWRAVACTAAMAGAFIILTLPGVRMGAVRRLPRPPPGARRGRGLPGVPKSRRDGDQLLDTRTRVQAEALRRSWHVLRSREDPWVGLHARRGGRDGVRGIEDSSRRREAAGVVGDPDPRDAAQPVPAAGLRRLPASLAAHAPGRELRLDGEDASLGLARLGRSQPLLAGRLGRRSQAARGRERGAAGAHHRSRRARPPRAAKEPE